MNKMIISRKKVVSIKETTSDCRKNTFFRQSFDKPNNALRILLGCKAN